MTSSPVICLAVILRELSPYEKLLLIADAEYEKILLKEREVERPLAQTDKDGNHCEQHYMNILQREAYHLYVFQESLFNKEKFMNMIPGTETMEGLSETLSQLLNNPLIRSAAQSTDNQEDR